MRNTLYRWFKKTVGILAYLYWIPFFYGVKSGHTLLGMGEIISTILLFCIGILLSMGFLGMCKHDVIPEKEYDYVSIGMNRIPTGLKFLEVWLLEVAIGVALNTPLTVGWVTIFAFIILLKTNWWIYNPVFMLFGIRFCEVMVAHDYQRMYLVVPWELNIRDQMDYFDKEDFKICTYNGKVDWIIFKK